MHIVPELLRVSELRVTNPSQSVSFFISSSVLYFKWKYCVLVAPDHPDAKENTTLTYTIYRLTSAGDSCSASTVSSRS